MILPRFLAKKRSKINVIPCRWDHQLETGGWGWVSDALKKKFHDECAEIDLYTAYEYQVRSECRRPFIAFFHQVVEGYERSLSNIVKTEIWKKNRTNLLGGLTVSEAQKKFLQSHGVNNVFTVLHPTPLNVPLWQAKLFLETRHVYHIGLHCRNTEFFAKQASQKNGNLNYIYISASGEVPEVVKAAKIRIIPHLTPAQYNNALASGIVFLNLTAATANNTILECIARGTPVIVNPVGGVPEYLGAEYPLYYRTEPDAKTLLENAADDVEMLNLTHEYLLARRSQFSISRFLSDVERCLNLFVSTRHA